MLYASLEKSVRESNRFDHVAVASDEHALTYQELLVKVNRFSNVLLELDIGPGQILLAYLDNEPAFLVVMLACAKTGCTFAPIDISLTDDEIGALLSLTKGDIIVCDASDAEHCRQFSQNTISVSAKGDVEETQIVELAAKLLEPGVACMQFSSGSTAASKGILLSEEAFFYRSYYLMRSLGLSVSDKTLCTLPLSHTHGSECLALPTLMAGGTLYLKSPRFSFPLYILEELARLQITFFSSIPQFYDFAVKISGDKTPDLSALRHPFCGSAALAKITSEAFFAKYGVHIKQGYGLAELSVICINLHDEGEIVYDAIGRPIEGIEWKIKDESPNSRHAEAAPQEGELIVRSKAMFSGYINDEQTTRDKLKQGWLHTGDIVAVDGNGLFKIVGRKEDFVKINGLKVYAAEIEAEIIGLEWVKECAVLFEKDELATETIVAYIVPNSIDAKKEPSVLEKELLHYLRGRISDYKIPRQCVICSAFPKSPLGKILKTKIRADCVPAAVT